MMNEAPAPAFTTHSITEKKIHRTALGSGYVRYFFVVMAILFFRIVIDYEGKPVGKMTVTRSNGKLYLQLDGQEKQEMGAKSGTELFVKTVNVRFSFVKGADSTVTKAIFHQGPQIVEMLKLKHP